MLKNGTIDVKGNFQDLIQAGTDFSSFLTEEKEEENQQDQLTSGMKISEDSAAFA